MSVPTWLRRSGGGHPPRVTQSKIATSTTVTAYPNGPLVIRGDFTVTDADGEQVPIGRMAALCRCGRSARKPLCDGSHRNK